MSESGSLYFDYIDLTINQLTSTNMFSKQNLLATLAGTVTMFLLGYLIWGIATQDFFDQHNLTDMMKSDEEMNMVLILLGNLCGAFALSTLYGRWSGGTYRAGDGFQMGAWVGFLIGVGMGLVIMGTSNMMDATGHAVEAVLDIIYYGLVGMVIAIVYKATAPKAS